MFNSLFLVKMNWLLLFALACLTYLLFPNMSVLGFLAVLVSLHQGLLVFYSLNHIIPIRYLAGTLMCMQILIGPVLAYNGANVYQYAKYQMQVPEAEYFSYALPACIFFILGLHAYSRLRGEKVDQVAIADFTEKYPNLAYYFIAFGFLTSFGTGVEGSVFSFFFAILSGFKYVGLFMLLLGRKKLKILPLVLVMGSVISSSLTSAMFHDLITWLVFLIAVLCIKYKPSITVKSIFGILFVLAIVVLQLVKASYRSAIGYQSGRGGVEVFQNVVETSAGEESFFSTASLARASVRINQGFIVTYVMSHVPAREPYANGEELYKVVEAAILPRFLAPNKLNAGDNSLVLKYAGIPLSVDTSMSLSALGDGYANFGLYGGIIFMFFLGCAFNLILIGFHSRSLSMPVLILFMPLIYYYPIRPDTALQTSLGHLVKTSMVLYVFSLLWENKLKRVVKRKSQITPGSLAMKYGYK